MTPPSRRGFLLTAASSAAKSAILGGLGTDTVAEKVRISNSAEASDAAVIPPHRAIAAPGMQVYTDKPSYAAGETLTGYVSASMDCTIEIVRLCGDLDDPTQDIV